MSGSKDQQTGWLKELKKGDKVQLFKTNGFLGRTVTVETIKDITPTGEIVFSDIKIPANGILHYEGYKTIRVARVDEGE